MLKFVVFSVLVVCVLSSARQSSEEVHTLPPTIDIGDLDLGAGQSSVPLRRSVAEKDAQDSLFVDEEGDGDYQERSFDMKDGPSTDEYGREAVSPYSLPDWLLLVIILIGVLICSLPYLLAKKKVKVDVKDRIKAAKKN